MPEPLFEESNGGMRVTFFKPVSFEEWLKGLGNILSIKHLALLKEIKKNSSISVGELSSVLKISKPTTERLIKDLKEKGLLIKEGSAKSEHYNIIQKQPDDGGSDGDKHTLKIQVTCCAI